MAGEPVLVLGATGRTGRRVAARLRVAGETVRGVARGTDPAFDWAQPQTWEPALAGVERMYLMAPDGVAVDPAFVRAAVDAGVRRIVLLSSRAIETMGDERLLAAEATVRASGAEWTIVRPDWIDQNFDEGFLAPAVGFGLVTVPVGDVRTPFVDAEDIAAVVVAALTQDGHGGRTYEVTGPRALSFAEATAIVARAAQRPVAFDGSGEAYAAAMRGLGMPEEQTQAEIAAFAALAAEGDQAPTGDVERVTGRPPTAFEEYAAAAAARGAWRD